MEHNELVELMLEHFRSYCEGLSTMEEETFREVASEYLRVSDYYTHEMASVIKKLKVAEGMDEEEAANAALAEATDHGSHLASLHVTARVRLYRERNHN